MTNYGLLSKAQFQTINTAVVAHVQATFAVLSTVAAGIEDDSITTVQQIDSANWG